MVWSFTPYSDPLAVSVSESFTMDGVAKESRILQVSYDESGPLPSNEFASEVDESI